MDFKVEFEMNPQPRSAATPGMKVRIEIRDDNSVVVTGFANGQEFDGALLLQKKRPNFESFTKHPGLELATTDECWINGKWYNPCPTDPPPAELNGTGAQVSSEAEAD